jgi:predicted transcriptional regulator
LALGELVVEGENVLKVADALTSTSFRILQLLSKKSLNVSAIAGRLGLSEPYMSGQVRLLEELKIIRVSYEKGKRGIRKVCELAVKRITIIITP